MGKLFRGDIYINNKMNDQELIWEAYKSSNDIIEESVWSTIVEIFNDLKTSLKRGLKKEDIVYYLRLIKSRNVNYYNGLIKALKMRFVHGIGDERYDKMTDAILMVLMNVVALSLSIGVVITFDKLVPVDELIRSASKHKEHIIKVIEDLDNAVTEKIKDKVDRPR